MKHNLFKRGMSVLLAVVLVLSLIPAAIAVDAPKSDDLVILYTNDVHTYIDGKLSYANIAAMKQNLAAAGNEVLLVDAGDHIQGTAYGSMDNGKTIIDLMNASGYDLATLGNHEFDYGMARALEVIEQSDYPYVSCNFYDLENEKLVLDAYKVFQMGDKKVAFVGMTTPESFTKSTPAYFQNEAGEYIYDIFGGNDGELLYAAAQEAIDAASKEADYVIALGHLGDDPASQPWTSEELIANTTGLDAFIDGHSHSTVPMREVKDKAGETVVLTQTGSYYASIGQMTIGTDGTIKTGLVTEYAPADEKVAAIANKWIDSVKTELGQVIGATTVTFDNYENGKRLVRTYETNTGDFCADALYYLFDNMGLDVDVAIMNGGGIRNKAITGEISYLTCKDIHTFGNVACLQTVTGQQILDALEWGARFCEGAECGGFLQVSGLTYEINVNAPNTVQSDEKSVWIGGPTGEYRVRNVQVWDKESDEFLPLDLEAKYNLAGYNYTLRDLGDGFAMFDGAVNVVDYVAQDYMVLANYVQSFPKDPETGLPTITAENSPYGDVHGSDRIKISKMPTDVPRDAWYYEDVEDMYRYGLMNGTSATTFSPMKTTTRAELATVLYRLAMALEDDAAEMGSLNVKFSDVKDGSWYAEAINWCASCGIVNGYPDGTFKPNAAVTREDVVTMIYRLADAFDGNTKFEGDLSAFKDAASVHAYAVTPMTWAVDKGLIIGTTAGTLEPRANMRRCELAALLNRIIE